MTKNEIILLHDRLYEYLKGLHLADPTFGFDTYNHGNVEGYWFNSSEDLLMLSLNNHAKNIPCFQIEFTYRHSIWYCEISELDLNYKLINSKSRAKQSVELLYHLLDSLGFSKRHDGWTKPFSKNDDFLQSFDAFMKKEYKEINDFFKKKLRLSETDKDEITSKSIEIIEKEKQSGHAKERYRLLKQPFIPHLPFALSRLEVIDFQGIKHLIIEDIPTDIQWIFLTGENGFGKTSVLRSLAKGFAGNENFMEPLPKNSKIYVNGYNWNQPFSRKAHETPAPIGDWDVQLVGYGASRFQLSNIDASNDSKGRTNQKTYSLFYDNGILKNIERLLIDKERDDIPTFNHLKAIFLKIIPNLADIRSELIDKERQIRYYEKSDNGAVYNPVLLHELAAGYRGILTMIGDMVQRLSAHPKNSLEDLQGIVLIDEFDAHLHPKYQYELPKLLSEIFPKVQFIVSTHSPIPLLGVKPNTSIVLTVHRTSEVGITVERLDDDIEIRRLSVNALLSSPIFNFQKIFAEEATPESIIPENDYSKVPKSAKLALIKQKMNALNLKPSS